jgi:alkylhydroperoxidase family enzyme
MIKPRIEPLNPPYEETVATTIRKMMPPNAGQEPLKLFRVLARHQDLTDRMRPLASGILGHGLLRPRDRELVILRTCANCKAEYEWAVHVTAFGSAAGLSEAEIIATTTLDNTIWSEKDAILLTMVDELHHETDVTDETWAKASDYWETAQLLEILIVAGWYRAISYVCNVARVPLESWSARFPQE